MAHSGGCFCGKVRYEIGAEPITTRVCWCRDCQKIGAGGPTVNAAFPSSALKVTGELRDYPSTAGNKMHRKFCPKGPAFVPVLYLLEARERGSRRTLKLPELLQK